MGLLLSCSHLHGENNSLQSVEFYTDQFSNLDLANTQLMCLLSIQQSLVTPAAVVKEHVWKMDNVCVGGDGLGLMQSTLYLGH